MAYKEASRVEIIEVIRQWQAGHGIREIARSTGIARNTVRKYVLAAQSCGVARDGPPPDEAQITALVQLGRAGPRDAAVPTDKLLEPWADQILHWIKSDKDKLTLVQDLLAQSRIDHTLEKAFRSFLAPDLLILDDFGLQRHPHRGHQLSPETVTAPEIGGPEGSFDSLIHV